jgi:hypothetical protein
MKIAGVVVVALFEFGCSKSVTAMDVCRTLEKDGVAANCREDKPGGLGAAAIENAQFDLPSVPGKTGQVMRFDRSDAFEATETLFVKAAMLAGPHRYGNKQKMIFVQINQGLSLELGKAAKATVDKL